MADLLPKNSTALERALVDIAYDFNNPTEVIALWNANTCPLEMLPYLAWALSVDEWDYTWSEGRKRAACHAAREIHQHKGTLYGIKRALVALGQPDAVVIERSDFIHYNGLKTHNGMQHYMGQAGWASYRVLLSNPITIDQAQLIARVLESTKRFCVKLVAIDFTQAALRYGGAQKYNGLYTHGVVL